MCETCTPISSMWPTTISVGPPAVPETRAYEEPTLSDPTSVANSAQPSRQTLAGSVSWPDGPAALIRRWSSSGVGTARRLVVPQQAPQDVLQDPTVEEIVLLLGR